MTASELLRDFLDQCPLIAIIRGVIPGEAEAIGEAIFEGGIRIIEVPLNSPDPLASIERLARKLGDKVLVGAGTVIEAGQVLDVQSAGGRIIVSPNTNLEVIAASAAAGLVSSPGFFTPSEAFAAIAAGATGLKLFPAEGASPAVMKAQLAVIPKEVPVMAVGGIQRQRAERLHLAVVAMRDGAQHDWFRQPPRTGNKAAPSAARRPVRRSGFHRPPAPRRFPDRPRYGAWRH